MESQWIYDRILVAFDDGIPIRFLSFFMRFLPCSHIKVAIMTPRFGGFFPDISPGFSPDYPKGAKKNSEELLPSWELAFFGGKRRIIFQSLVGGFNPFEKYQPKWESSPSRGKKKKYLKPPPRSAFVKEYVCFPSTRKYIP